MTFRGGAIGNLPATIETVAFALLLEALLRLEPAAYTAVPGEALTVRIHGATDASALRDAAIYGKLAYNMLSPRLENGVVAYTARIKERGLLTLAVRSGAGSAKAVVISGAAGGPREASLLGWALELALRGGRPRLFIRGTPAPETIPVVIRCGKLSCAAYASHAGETTSLSYPID
jgi:hypothetical protein